MAKVYNLLFRPLLRSGHCAPHCFTTLWMPVAIEGKGAGTGVADVWHRNQEPVEGWVVGAGVGEAIFHHSSFQTPSSPSMWAGDEGGDDAIPRYARIVAVGPVGWVR